MIIIGVIMHHYTRGGRFHPGGESSSSAIASAQSSLSLAPVVGKSLPRIIIIILIIINHYQSLPPEHLRRNFGSTSSAFSSLVFPL